jgi:hypothetical protein
MFSRRMQPRKAPPPLLPLLRFRRSPVLNSGTWMLPLTNSYPAVTKLDRIFLWRGVHTGGKKK